MDINDKKIFLMMKNKNLVDYTKNFKKYRKIKALRK